MDCSALIDRYNRLRSVRDGFWINVFREVRKYCYPTYSDYLTEGGTRGQYLFDTTAVEARERLAAGMYNWMAPPDQRWFEIVPQDDRLAADEEVKEYFAKITKRVAFAMANSNWSSVLVEALNNLACGLDAIVYCEDGGTDSVLNFRSFPVETVCYSFDSKGKVDTVFREVEMTARQIVIQFQEGNIPDEIRRESADPALMDKKYRLLHAVYPRSDRREDLADNVNMPVADVYIDMQRKVCLSESGFEEHPFAVCHFQKSDNETYGRGPGLNKLPDIKMLNRMRQAYILAVEHQADPSYLVPDGSLVNNEFNRNPGAVIIYKPDVNNAKPEVLPNHANVLKMQQDIEAEREKIRMGFFVDIFDPLGDLKQITATEAQIRNEGKMVPFAPIAGNLHSDLFRVIIHRVFGILQRRGLLPDPPGLMGESPEYKIEFVSKIALSIKKIEAVAWLQTEASLSHLMQLDPGIADNFDFDEIARNVALVNGVSPEWVRSVKDRDLIRQDRTAAQQEQQAAGMIMEGAGALGNNLSKAPEPGSPLDAVLRGEGV